MKIVEAKQKKTYHIKTYGCAMNVSDSEKIDLIMKGAGFQNVNDEKKADIIIINTCSIRQQAEDKIFGWGIKAKKPIYNKKTYILTGCMAVRYDRKTGEFDTKYAKKLKLTMPWVDCFVDNNDFDSIPEVLGVSTKFNKIHENQKCSNNTCGLFPISTGCDNFCSYCIVPFTRGELINRKAQDILSDITKFIKCSGKLVTLVGQNVNSWTGREGNKKLVFADLLKKVCAIEGDFWVNFISSNPMDFSDEIIGLLATENKLMKSVNLAVQSGSDDVLKKMNRHYTVEKFIGIAEKIKNISDFRLTTDIIIGFPGETEDDFQKTLDLIEKVGFDMIYVGKYSPRKGTVSAKLTDDVSQEVKIAREIELKNLVNKIRIENNKNLIGKKIDVLVMGGQRGISYFNHEVNFTEPVEKELIGTFVNCEVISSNVKGLVVTL